MRSGADGNRKHCLPPRRKFYFLYIQSSSLVGQCSHPCVILLTHGRTLRCPQPYGINYPGAFAFVFSIIYPVYVSGSGDPTENFLVAYKVALAGNFVSGIISVVLGVMGSKMLAIIPPAALVVPLGGIAFAFLGLEQAATPFGAPVVGFLTITFVFLSWHSNVRLSWGNVKIPEVMQVILVGIGLGWLTGLNKSSDMGHAADLIKWYGPTWAGQDIADNLSSTKDYLGIIIPIAISTVGNSLMSLVSAKTAGDAYPVTESMIVDGLGTIIASLFGSPFGTVMYFGHSVYKKSGAKSGYSLINGIVYLFISWVGLFGVIRSLVSKATVGPIVLFVGLAMLEECFRYLPSRHLVVMVFGLFPSICDWVTNIADRAPMSGVAEDGTVYNSNLPDDADWWWGVLGFKRGAVLVSLCWVAILVHIIDRKWWQAACWALISAIFSAVGIIHVPVAGFMTDIGTISDLCTPMGNSGSKYQPDIDGIVATTNCWEHADQWQYMTAYLMMGVVFIALEGLRLARIGDLDAPIESPEANAFQDWYGQQDDDAAKRIGEEKTAEVEENAIATKEKGSFPAV
ncbi:unnamed protein product [Ascophyllum nodosum]